MADPLAYRALAAVIARLRTISVANGFNTDAGLYVDLARRRSTFDDLPDGAAAALTVFRGERTKTASGRDGEEVANDGVMPSYTSRFVINVEAHVLGDQDDTGLNLELLVADVERAMENADAPAIERFAMVESLGDAPTDRAEGDSTEAVTMQFVVVFKQRYGDPTQH